MAEKRLIDANALTRWLETNKSNANPLDYNTRATYAECITMVNAMETIDAVEVVRCRECIHRGDAHCPMRHEQYCDSGDYVTYDWTEDDGFCDQGAKLDAKDMDVPTKDGGAES